MPAYERGVRPNEKCERSAGVVHDSRVSQTKLAERSDPVTQARWGISPGAGSQRGPDIVPTHTVEAGSTNRADNSTSMIAGLESEEEESDRHSRLALHLIGPPWGQGVRELGAAEYSPLEGEKLEKARELECMFLCALPAPWMRLSCCDACPNDCMVNRIIEKSRQHRRKFLCDVGIVTLRSNPEIWSHTSLSNARFHTTCGSEPIQGDESKKLN